MNRLREIMKERDITQVDLSEKTGIAQSEISKIMNDRKPKLSLAQAQRVAKALNCSLEEIWPN
jgi:transcriptional regulator with XRE-family HTH domain